MKHTRRQYIINKRYQGRFIGLYVAVCALGIIATASTMLYYIHHGLDSRLYRTHLDIASTADVILPAALQVNALFFLLGVFVLGGLSKHYDRKADRIAEGLSAGMRKLRDGHLDFQVKVGHEDEFPDLERLMNGMIDANRARVSEVVKAVGKAEVAARELSEADRSDPEAMRAALHRMKLKAGAISRAVKAFTLERQPR